MGQDITPHVIQIIQSSPAWWQAWLPLLGSCIVAAAAFTGVLVSNRTNRKAISTAQSNVELANAAAEHREHEKWRRETLLVTATKVLNRSAEIRYRIQVPGNWSRDRSNSILNSLRADVEAVGATDGVFDIVSKSPIGVQSKNLRKALYDAVAAAGSLEMALHGDKTSQEDRRAARDAFRRAVNEVQAAEHSFIAAVRIELGFEPIPDSPES
ncbi:hypothetical protein [Nocardia sp. NPDC050710]|uniref:hypothetical protein n=1 Tax=Nocardia sp. NPDC050710 TaxID=3157220 RepID=UPI0033EA18DC